MRKIILLVFLTGFLTICFSEEIIIWKYYGEPNLKPPFVGQRDMRTGQYSHIDTVESFASMNDFIMNFIPLTDKRSEVPIFRIEYENLPKYGKQKHIQTKWEDKKDFVLMASTDKDVPILISFPLYYFIPDNRIYSITHGPQRTFAEDGDFFKGFKDGYKFFIKKYHCKLIKSIAIKNLTETHKYLYTENEYYNNLYYREITKYFYSIDDFDTASKFIEAYNSKYEHEKEYILDESLNIIPKELSYQIQMSLIPEESSCVKEMKSVNEMYNTLRSQMFNQSLQATNGYGFNNFLLRNSNNLGEITFILTLVLIVISIRFVFKFFKQR